MDGTGATFSAERVRAFPIRSWAARRWSIDHNVTDPAAAWAGYNAERTARRTGYPSGRLATAWAALTGAPPATVTEPDPPASGGTDGSKRPAKRAPRTSGGKNDTATAIARLHARYPDLSTTEIAKRLKVTDRTVRRHLARPDDDQPDRRGDAAPLAA